MSRPLWLWHHADLEPDMAAIKRAKVELALDFTIVPRYMTAETDARVLAIGTQPRWVGCDYWLVSEHCSAEELREAMAWALGDHEDWQATTVLDTMQAIFGPGTREILPDELESEIRMSNYLNYVD